MPRRDHRADWAAFDPAAIPSKKDVPQLQSFLQQWPAGNEERRLKLLDLGCGDGTLSRRLAAQGYNVLGVDINEAAIQAARAANSGSHYVCADIAAQPAPELPAAPYDLVICQLVISIIGGLAERQQLLQNVYHWLKPGGALYLSASGVSGPINAKYAALYAQDQAATGEANSYFSRDHDGQILYQTHHFEVDELRQLLTMAGFRHVEVTTAREASSRRPAEAAFFHYVTAIRGT